MDLEELLHDLDAEEDLALWMDDERPEGDVWDPETPALLRRQAD